MRVKFFLLLACSFIISSFMCKYVTTEKSGSLKLFLRTGGQRHSKDDVFLIPGKGCKGPTVLIEGGHQHNARGKTNLIMQGDCDQDKKSGSISNLKQDEQAHQKANNIIPLPIPIPVFKHFYHLPQYVDNHYPANNHYPAHNDWQPYTDLGDHHFQPPMDHNLVEHQIHHGEPVYEHFDHQYLNPSYEQKDSNDMFLDKLFADIFSHF